MSQELSVKLLLTGEGMIPGKVRSKDLAEVIGSIEEAVITVVMSSHPELDKNAVILGLKSIEDGSVGLAFSPSVPEYTLDAARTIGASIMTKRFNLLPYSTLEPLKSLARFAKSKDCNIEIIERNGREVSLATITPETKIPEVVLIPGETTLYGKITRVGGENPNIRLKTFDGQSVSCSASQALAKIAGKRLYQEVGLHGIGKFNPETFNLETFEATHFADYSPTDPSEALNRLREIAGEAFDRIPDLNAYFEELRYGGEE
ncbi:MAG: hypothetical protein GDA44_09480 [Prochloron sp. SP5CPC1]|nr:hypothetical protein [Candidatus Paraprochloron terpiosi SP5CPC1]